MICFVSWVLAAPLLSKVKVNVDAEASVGMEINLPWSVVWQVLYSSEPFFTFKKAPQDAPLPGLSISNCLP